MVLPLEASIGEASQSAAGAASLRRRVGLSPATRQPCGDLGAHAGLLELPWGGLGGERAQAGVELGDLIVEAWWRRARLRSA